MLAERWITLLGMADRAAVQTGQTSGTLMAISNRDLQLLFHSPTNND